MNEDQFCFTLFENKPVSLSGYFQKTPFEVVLYGDFSNDSFSKKWELWEKVKASLPITEFLFIKEPTFHNHPEGYEFIFLINKRAFIETVNQNLCVFQEVLGNALTAEKLLKTIEQDNSFMVHLKKSELLLGILLGYGEHNARLFEQRSLLRKIPLDFTYAPLIEEERRLNDRLNAFSTPLCFLPYSITPVQFAADFDSNETYALHYRYICSTDRIIEIYKKNPHFLTLILDRLVSVCGSED
jgi:hypothetical protein